MNAPTVTWHAEEVDYRDVVQVCDACGYVANSPSEQDTHEAVTHHECPQCGETFSDVQHPDHDRTSDGAYIPFRIAGVVYCHADCAHNALWDAGYAIVAGRLMTNVECLRRSRLQVVAA